MLKPLGGGTRYEVFLVWDDKLFSLAVAKVLRPAYAEEERALRELAEEAEALEALAHPVMVRGFDAVLDGEHPHLLIEHLEGPTLRRLHPPRRARCRSSSCCRWPRTSPRRCTTCPPRAGCTST